MGNAEGEITRVVSEGFNGNMFPIYTLGVVFGFIITLLTFIFKSTLREQSNKNDNYEKIMHTLTKNQVDMKVLLTKMDLQLEYHSEDIKENKSEIKEVKNEIKTR